MANRIRIVLGVAVSIILPTVIRFAILQQTGTTDPTAELMYWYFGYPLMIVVCAAFSFLVLGYWWLWGPLMLTTQFIIIVSWPTEGEKNLIPLAIIAYLIYLLPMLLASGLAAWLAHRRLKAR